MAATELVERMPRKTAIGEPSTKYVIETVRLCAFAPPGSTLDQQIVTVLPLDDE
jgi:hypothetical protein